MKHTKLLQFVTFYVSQDGSSRERETRSHSFQEAAMAWIDKTSPQTLFACSSCHPSYEWTEILNLSNGKEGNKTLFGNCIVLVVTKRKDLWCGVRPFIYCLKAKYAKISHFLSWNEIWVSVCKDTCRRFGDPDTGHQMLYYRPEEPWTTRTALWSARGDSLRQWRTHFSASWKQKCATDVREGWVLVSLTMNWAVKMVDLCGFSCFDLAHLVRPTWFLLPRRKGR